jgi:uncharacterized protein (TIGR02145 family)
LKIFLVKVRYYADTLINFAGRDWYGTILFNQMKKIFSVLVLVFLLLRVSGQELFTDPRDGNMYRTVTMGNVKWMVENLRYKAEKGTMFFDNDPSNISIYGALYDWKTAAKVCPDRWRLPSGSEFQKLIDHFDQSGSWKGGPSSKNSFDIQLGGMQDYEGTFTEMNESAYFWTSTEYDTDNAEYFSYIVVVKTPVADVSRKVDIQDIHGAEKTNKYSVRCVKD